MADYRDKYQYTEKPGFLHSVRRAINNWVLNTRSSEAETEKIWSDRLRQEVDQSDFRFAII